MQRTRDPEPSNAATRDDGLIGVRTTAAILLPPDLLTKGLSLAAIGLYASILDTWDGGAFSMHDLLAFGFADRTTTALLVDELVDAGLVTP